MALRRAVAAPLLLWASLSSGYQGPRNADKNKPASRDKQKSRLGMDAAGQLFHAEGLKDSAEALDRLHLQSHATNQSAKGHRVNSGDLGDGGALLALTPSDDSGAKSVGPVKPSSKGKEKPEDECGACSDGKKCNAKLVKKDDKFSDCPSKKPEPGLGWQPVFAIQSGSTGKFTVTLYDKDDEETKWPGEENATNCYVSSAMLAESEDKIVCVSIKCVDTDVKCNIEFSFEWDQADVKVQQEVKKAEQLGTTIAIVVVVVIVVCVAGGICWQKSQSSSLGHGGSPGGGGQWSGEGEWGGGGEYGGGGGNGAGGEWGAGGGGGEGGGGGIAAPGGGIAAPGGGMAVPGAGKSGL